MPNADGRGFSRLSNGVYEGEFANNNKHGKGEYRWNDGTVFKGEYRDDEMNGSGAMLFYNGEKYEGEVKDNKLTGSGKYTYKSGDVLEGNFCDCKAYGRGTYKWANGDVYVGEFKNSKKSGSGEFIRMDGWRYTGGVEMDRPTEGEVLEPGGRRFHVVYSEHCAELHKRPRPVRKERILDDETVRQRLKVRLCARSLRACSWS